MPTGAIKDRVIKPDREGLDPPGACFFHQAEYSRRVDAAAKEHAARNVTHQPLSHRLAEKSPELERLNPLFDTVCR